MEGPKVHSAESLEESLKGLFKKQQNKQTNKKTLRKKVMGKRSLEDGILTRMSEAALLTK